MVVSTTVLLQSGVGRQAGAHINIKAGLELANVRLGIGKLAKDRLSMGMGGHGRQPKIGCYLVVMVEE